MPNPLNKLLTNVFSPIIEKTIRDQLTISETENTFFVGTRRYDETERDRLDYDRTDILEQCLEAWRESPLARRIVELTSQYAIGGGFDIKCKHEKTKTFIDHFWTHRLNRMDSRIVELCDELTRTGNLFLLISTDASGMSFIRAIPATNIDQIVHADNDIEQPTLFITKADEDLKSMSYPAYNELTDTQNENGSFQPVVLHYAINRPAGAQWGESDLAPLLPWLRRYSAWLEDRVRLNRFRNAFVYVVSGSFTSEASRKARQLELAANPPSPGSILVCDESETWSVISPKLEALDAMQDGLALKKLIASGVGIPMHFLAEPEGSNRATAESAGGPTFKRFEQRQRYFMWLISDFLKVVIARRSLVDHSVDPDTELKITGSDISARDNVAHSIASVNILNTLERLKDMGLISDRELLRAVYRFAGEPVDIDEILSGGSGIDIRESTNPIQPVTKDPVNTETGNPKKSVLP
ncbi:MAG: hypothetical protein SVP52_07580 [Chloroflexota bacterium]|nr:hypothetical protein [Chloroflexota bacterium]